MTAAPGGLERHYRRLLWAYPGAYRRRHGAEIVTTLLEMAESGPGRPTVAQALHLVACGVRQRFRLPAGRPLPVVAAVLAAIVLGAPGAAGGTWLGWQTATPLPSGEGTRALTAAIAGNPFETHIYPWQTAMRGPAVTSTATGRSPYSAERVRSALTSAGWRVTTLTEEAGAVVVDFDTEPWDTAPARTTYFAATKGGLSLKGSGMTVVGGGALGTDGRADLGLDIWVPEAAAVRPLTIAGLLVGMVAGWLLAAALVDRARRDGRIRRRIAAATGATALIAAVPPADFLYRDLYQVLTYDVGAPNPYIVATTSDGQLLAAMVPACTGIALVALAVTLLVAVRASRADPGPDASESVAAN